MTRSLTDETDEDTRQELLDGISSFIDSEVLSRHDRHAALFEDARALYEDDGRYVPEVLRLLREVRMASAEAGFYTMFVPSSLGGAGLSGRLLYDAWETVFRRCGPHNWLGHHMIGHWAKGPSPVLQAATEELRTAVLPKLLSGETSLCFAISEPDAGTDLWMMKTMATRDGDGWRINGIKQWITNGPYAENALVFAVTDLEALKARRGGVTAFLVPTDSPGFTTASVIKMFGSAGGDEAVFHLDGVPVRPEHVIGTVDQGLSVGLLGIGLGRIYNAAKAVGYGRWALAMAMDQVRSRETFGRPLSDRQGIMFPLAESAMELHAARLMARDCATKAGTEGLGVPEVSMAKAFATEAGIRAVDRVVQVHGASGLTNELHLIHAWKELRKIVVADGSAEIMRRSIGQAMLSGKIRF